MRIPLDYYQILGVPESNLSELEQAYRDRLHQMPRQGYSDAAIESRKQLMTIAYEVLSDPLQQKKYAAAQSSPDPAEDLANPPTDRPQSELFAHRPDLEIEPEHFLGALIILFEQGKYEEVNSICMPYIGTNGRSSNSGSLHPASWSGSGAQTPTRQIDAALIAKGLRVPMGNNIIPLKPDIVLTMAFSLLEMGDREWKEGNYEAAGSYFETARKILVQEDLFPQIQGQIDRRLDRLRPYCISYLVALPLDRHEQRRQGIQFLEELLDTACTNESECQDRFGLNSERTIQFIHETLHHLTAAEQSNLFSHLARESHQSKALNAMQLACTYLHVHALIAQGFAYRNPHLIYRSQQILLYRLSQRLNNVAIDEATCCLLLGQIEAANQILNSMPDSAALVVIRQQSQGLPNLTRGLCWYVESWFKEEVFPCFRDLKANDPSLEAYFNNQDVRDFADRIPATDRNVGNWAASSPQLIDVPTSGDLSGGVNLPNYPVGVNSPTTPDLRVDVPAIGGRRSGTFSSHLPSSTPVDSENVPTAERVIQTPPAPEPPTTSIDEQVEGGNKVIQLERERLRRRPTYPTARTIDGQLEPNYAEDSISATASNYPDQIAQVSGQLVPTGKSGKLVRGDSTSSTLVRRRRRRLAVNVPRLLLVSAGGATCLFGSIWLGNMAINQLKANYGNTAPTAKLPAAGSVTNGGSPGKEAPIPVGVGSPSAEQKPAVVGLLTTNTAQQVVQTWLGAKAKSLDKEYQIAELKNILREPALSRAIERAQSEQAAGVYWKYKHASITVPSIEQANPQSKIATIQAQVQEDAEYYERDRLNPARSYSKKLLVRYELIRQADSWYINEMKVLKEISG